MTHRDQILSVFADGRPHSSVEVAARTGLTTDQAAKRIHDARSTGRLHRVGVEEDTGYCLYQIPGRTKPLTLPGPTSDMLHADLEGPAARAAEIAARALAESGQDTPRRCLLRIAQAAQDAIDAYIDTWAETDPVCKSLTGLLSAAEDALARHPAEDKPQAAPAEPERMVMRRRR